MRRAVLYLRQSDSDGEGERSLSMDSQATALREDAARLGWRVVGELRDADLKGYDEKRPGLVELYARCRSGDVDVVAFWKLDRFARLLRLQENVVHELDQLGVELYSNQEPWVGNPFFRQILGAVNEEQTRVISAHVRRAMRERQRRGFFQGRVPWGYLRPNPASVLVIDPKVAPIVRWMYEESAAGRGVVTIARLLDERGVRAPRGGRWCATTVRALLRRVAYRGAMRVGETMVEGAHPAIVEPELWERGQPGQYGRRAPRTKDAGSWLEGHVEHACGYPMYLTVWQSKRRFRCRLASAGVLHGGQGVCAFAPKSIDAERLETMAWEAVTEALARMHSPRQVLARAKEELHAAAPASDAAYREAQDRRARAEARRERAEELYLSGSRDRAWFDVEDARALAEIADAERVLAKLPIPPDPAAIEETWQSLRGIRDMAARVESTDRGIVLRSVGSAVLMPRVGSYGPKEGGEVQLRPHQELRRFIGDSGR